MIGIYKFTNKITGESYIGQSKNIQKRYSKHKTCNDDNTYFHKMLRHYGFHNFDFEVIEECLSFELNEREIYWIKKLKTLYPNGYNISAGGSKPHVNRLSSINDVETIINLLKNSNLSNGEIGKLFNVSDQTVSDINTGHTWYSDKYEYPIRQRITPKYFCSHCGKEITSYSKSGLCVQCLQSSKSNIPSKETLYSLLSKYKFVEVAKMFSVSDRTIKNWCLKLGIPDKAIHYRKFALV